MQFTNRSQRKQIKLSGERNADLYPHTLQLYKYPPLDTISLEEFENLALDRLQVLRIVEHAGAKHSIKTSNDYRDAIISELRKQNLSSYYKITVDESFMTDQMYDERRKDHISHFILRLAYCRSDSLRRWFVSQEVDLFRLRFISEKMQNRKLFMELNKLNYKPIDKHEKTEQSSNLAACVFNSSSSKVMLTEYYKVPFIEVLDLVRHRKVYLVNGYAYIAEHELVFLVVTAFRSHLSHALAITSRALPQLEEDDRLLSMLSTIHQRYIGTDYSSSKYQSTGEVVPEMLDRISKESYPLCMRSLHDTLRQTHHLKYFGRLQYGLFLKGIGMTLEDSLRFWREEFSRTMDIDKFDRQYAYGVRYNYGKEGKRANFTPYSCMKIIVSNPPGAGDCHGCPFKHDDSEALRRRLQNLHVNNSGIKDIMDLTGKGHYQLACTRYFEATHNEATPDQAISHPNQYYEQSQKVNRGENRKEDRNTARITTSRSVIYSTNEQNAPSTSSATNNIEDDFDMDDIEELLKGIKGS